MVRLDTLQEAWERVRDNAGGPGGDGQTVGQFAIQSPTRLLRLRRDLIGGTYRPGPLRPVDIRKDDGSLRRLSIPCVIDRVAQTAAATALMPVLEPEMRVLYILIGRDSVTGVMGQILVWERMGCRFLLASGACVTGARWL
ncbi:hypothetical protein F1188_15505 [Roseospira marina]|uniref:Uncharacterized protein n=1 Tax=Roseospira marina TaxID=140057 RepID=A0A5M6I8C7_9PROT|nr:hypothetical protein [Roseospira marina]KAA5604451.1 hypothetical protein F1188_15505 [Roseospira marina]MBB4315495.1 retron-type reverse transcriptase [Roseospira marina]MBB5088569.1 retron-type reverse transcriptase [Roseospira marina]